MAFIIRYTKIYPAGTVLPGWEEVDLIGSDDDRVEDYFFNSLDELPSVGSHLEFAEDWIVTAIYEYISKEVDWAFAEVLLTQDGVLPTRPDWSHKPPVLTFDLVGQEVPSNIEPDLDYSLWNPDFFQPRNMLTFQPRHGRPIRGFDMVAVKSA